MRVISEVEEANPKSPTTPSNYSPLEVGQTTVGHTNIISDLDLVKHPDGNVFLVSAAMNGVIKFWK